MLNPDNPKEHSFSGRRISRGQYKSMDKTIINADVNGSANIMRKSIQGINIVDLLGRGCLSQPVRIRVLNQTSCEAYSKTLKGLG